MTRPGYRTALALAGLLSLASAAPTAAFWPVFGGQGHCEK